jgi:hypothetical protein
VIEYRDFLKRKMVEYEDFGFEASVSNDLLFPWQRAVTEWALKKGKSALFLDTGLGKTAIQLQWAQEIVASGRGDVIILAPLAVSQQTVREGVKFGIDVNLCKEPEDVRPGINITNYERVDRFNVSRFVGVVLDESSILKSFSGVVKNRLMQYFRGTDFKLACTATPSPNDHMEILNHADFLDIMRSSEALAIWFINDSMNMGSYRLKGHGKADFWRWVSSWAVGMTTPADIGYDDTGYQLPQLTEREIIVDVDESIETGGELIRNPDMSATGYHREKRITAPARVEKVAGLVNGDSEQWAVWCETNDEATQLKAAIPDAVEIRGSDTAEKKERAAMDFIDGNIRVLISKPSIFGFGLNFQQCHNVAFCGLSYSYEDYYQAVRRFYRFGQQKPVNVWIVIAKTERNVLSIVHQKMSRHADMQQSMVNEIGNSGVERKKYALDYPINESMEVPRWLKSV